MKIESKHWAAILLGTSLSVIAVSFDIIQIGEFSINAKIFSVDNIGTKRPEVLLAILVGIISVSMFFHFLELCRQFNELFNSFYRSNKELICYVQNTLSKEIGHNSCGAPTSNVSPGIRNKPANLGKYIKSNGNSTKDIVVVLPNKIHIKCFLYGILKSISSREIVFGFFPIFFGVWSIYELVI